MFASMDENDVAKLSARFIVPIVVSRMLHDEEELDDIAEHAMQEILAELHPDTALLCLALCARHIAAHTPNVPISRALAAETETIIADYGPLLLSFEHLDIPAEASEDIRDLLHHVPEDLEALADLLDATLDELNEEHSIAAILCDILGTQARMHQEYAELELARYETAQPFQAAGITTSQATPEEARYQGDNIIPFPGPGHALKPI